MVFRLSGGRDVRIVAPFMIFKNKNRRYSIRRVSDEVDGVSYRTSTKAWMDCVVMPLRLREGCTIEQSQNRRERIIFLDNCDGQYQTQDVIEALVSLETKVRFSRRMRLIEFNRVLPLKSKIINMLRAFVAKGTK